MPGIFFCSEEPPFSTRGKIALSVDTLEESDRTYIRRDIAKFYRVRWVGETAAQAKTYIKELESIRCPTDAWLEKDLVPLTEGTDHCDTRHIIRSVCLVYHP